MMRTMSWCCVCVYVWRQQACEAVCMRWSRLETRGRIWPSLGVVGTVVVALELVTRFGVTMTAL